MYKRYVVRLTDQERSQLQTLVRRGRAHARILLKADADGPDRWADERIAQAFEVSAAMVARERRRFCEDGLEVVLMPRKPGRPRRKVLDGRAEAHLLALACSEAPEGRSARASGSWPTGWPTLGTWIRSPTRRCAGRSKNLYEGNLTLSSCSSRVAR